MEEADTIRQAAEVARRARDWQAGAQRYSELLDLVYHDNDDDLSIQVCKDLVHYAECLIESAGIGGEDDDLETAWECLENARLGYEKMKPEDVPDTGLTDVHELLGEICMKNLNFAECANQYKIASDIALSKPNLSWRIPLNSLYMRAVALDNDGKKTESREAFARAIAFLDSEKVKEKNAADVAAMEAIRADLRMRSERETE
jgi:hypothetical protein